MSLKRFDIINYYLSQKQSPTAYLEIGVENRRNNFKRIQADHKDGVDPNFDCTFRMTSDEFFINNRTKYDVIFIDGDHHYEQAYKDIGNSLNSLKPNGTILMHDCNPPSEQCQVDKYVVGALWTGTVWKAFARYRCENDIEMFVIDTDWGVGVLNPSKKQETLKFAGDLYSYSSLEKHRKEILNLITVKEWMIRR